MRIHICILPSDERGQHDAQANTIRDGACVRDASYMHSRMSAPWFFGGAVTLRPSARTPRSSSGLSAVVIVIIIIIIIIIVIVIINSFSS